MSRPSDRREPIPRRPALALLMTIIRKKTGAMRTPLTLTANPTMIWHGFGRAFRRALALALIFGLGAVCAMAQTAPAPAPRPVSADLLRHPDPADWLMWRRTYDGFGFSPLKEITPDNVKDLRVAWTWSLASGPTETTPLVHDGILYVWNYGDKVQALNAATGDLLWEYRRDLPDALADARGNDLTKRNMALFEDQLIIATSDVHLVALDARTGKVVWDHEVADWRQGWRYTGGPMVANGVVLQGMTGCGNGQPGGCFITGHDAKTGAEKWRVWSVAHPGDPNAESWNGVALENRFGLSVWAAASFDPDRGLAYFGIAEPYPWIAEMRGALPAKSAPGITDSALYSDSTLAIDVATGKVKWYYQHLPNDTWDMDDAFEQVLVDLPINGVMRNMVVTTGKLGMIEAVDRGSGAWLWAKETVPQNIIDAIDPKTGAKTINAAAIPHIGQTTMNCPSDPGARGWPATAYDPARQTLYLPLNEFCAYTTPLPLKPGETYRGGGGRATFARNLIPGSDGNIGRIDAVKLADRSTAWSFRFRAPATSAVLPTAGGVVFAGAWDRVFRALDSASGKVLWQVRTNNAVNSFPISYAVGGRQYVAVAVGNGSGQGQELSTLVPNMPLPEEGAVLWVFALPEAH